MEHLSLKSDELLKRFFILQSKFDERKKTVQWVQDLMQRLKIGIMYVFLHEAGIQNDSLDWNSDF